jgi:hypothetical protein
MKLCPHCHSDSYHKKGFHTDTGKQRYKCNSCKKGFVNPIDANEQPDGYIVKGQSRLYDEDGNVKLTWEKTDRKSTEVATALRSVVDAMKEEIKPVKPTPISRTSYIEELLNLYVITDYHLGMMSWAEESGDEWNMQIAEDMLVNWFTCAVKASPSASTAVLANIGDFLHWDGFDAVTPASKHVLDADTRYQHLIRVTIRVMRRVISILLDKYEYVHVLMCDANHDQAGEAWLREMFKVLYEIEPRVSVDNSAETYYCVQHGKVSLFFHHGHKRKVGNIDTVFASKFREVFGETEHSYAHMGHLHSIDVKETNLMVVEQHRTLAASDAYASRGGHKSGRDAKVITYHEDYGEVARATISAKMLA